MKLVVDVKKVVFLSYSFWAQVLGTLLIVVPEGVYSLTGIDLDPVLLGWMGLFLLAFGILGRCIQQNGTTWFEWVKILAVLATIYIASSFLATPAYAYGHDRDTKELGALDVAVPLIARWEGLRLDAYLDIVGVPTICYGSTRGITLGMSKTRAQCEELLRDEVAEYHEGWTDYLTSQAYENWLTPWREAAYTSLAFNCGISAIGKSTATRRLNAGDIAGGCHAISWWNKAGGRRIRSLGNRRTEEVELCLQAI